MMTVFAPKEIQLQRLEICRQCPEYKHDSGKCGVCSCVMEVKVKLGFMGCPLKKFKPV